MATTYVANEDIERGDVVCVAPDPEWAVKKATPAHLASAGSVLGIAVSGAKAGESVQVADSGAVPESITGLGHPPLGASRTVIVNANARCAWLTASPPGQDFAVGVGDAAGNVTIQTHSGIGTGGTRVLNVALFGALFDGETDDAPAIQAAIRALDARRGGIVLCPFGKARLAQTVEIDRPVVIQGAGGSSAGDPAKPGFSQAGTEFIVDAGVTGFRIHSSLEHQGALPAGWSVIRDILIRAGGRDRRHTTGTILRGTNHDPRRLTVADATGFQVGQIIRIAGAGHSSTQIRAKATTAKGMTEITVNAPGCLLWPEDLEQEASGAPLETTQGDSGQRLSITKNRPGKIQHFLENGTRALTRSVVTDPGTKLAIEGTYTLSAAATDDITNGTIMFYEDLFAEIRDISISDNVLTLDAFALNSVTDAPVTHADAGVVLYDRARLYDVHVHGFQGPGILVSGIGNPNPPGSTTFLPGSNANTFGLIGCRATQCLHGVYVVGKDANAGYGINLDVMENRLFGLVDASDLGNTWIGCHVSGGRGYKTVGFLNRSTFVGCYTEGGTGNLFSNGAIILGGVMSADVLPGSALVGGTTATMGMTQFGVARQGFSDYAVTMLPVGARTSVADAAVAAMSLDSDPRVFGEKVKHHELRRPIFGDGVGAIGWWGLQSGRAREGWAWLWSDGDAPEGLGQIWFPHGMFVGTAPAGYLDSTLKRRISYADASRIKTLRGNPGDFMFNRSPVLQDGSVILGWSCVKGGDPGEWVACRCPAVPVPK